MLLLPFPILLFKEVSRALGAGQGRIQVLHVDRVGFNCRLRKVIKRGRSFYAPLTLTEDPLPQPNLCHVP